METTFKKNLILIVQLKQLYAILLVLSCKQQKQHVIVQTKTFIKTIIVNKSFCFPDTAFIKKIYLHITLNCKYIFKT